jgi:hypothetical protein
MRILSMLSAPSFRFALISFLLCLGACGGGGGGGDLAPGGELNPLLLELTPRSRGTTVDASISISGRTAIPAFAVFVGSKAAAIDPVTNEFSIEASLEPGANSLRLDIITADNEVFQGVAEIEILRVAGPELRIDSMAVEPGGQRIYFIEEDEQRWLTALDVATGARERLVGLGTSTPGEAPIPLFWDHDRNRLLLGEAQVRAYSPSDETLLDVLPQPFLGGRPLSFSTGANPLLGFLLADLNGAPVVHGVDFAANSIGASAISSNDPGLLPTTLGHDIANNRLLGVASSNGTLRVLSFAVSTGLWSELFDLGESGVAASPRPASIFARAQGRLLAAYELLDDAGRSEGLALRSIDIESGAVITRDLPLENGHLPSPQPALAYDPMTGRVYVGYGRRFQIIDPVTLATVDSVGNFGPVISGSQDAALPGAAFLDENRSELIQVGRTSAGETTVIATGVRTRARRRLAVLPEGFDFRLVNLDLDRDVAWGRLEGPGGGGTRPLVRISLGDGGFTLLSPLPTPNGTTPDLLGAREMSDTLRPRILLEDGGVYELAQDGGPWTLITDIAMPDATRWNADASGDVYGSRFGADIVSTGVAGGGPGSVPQHFARAFVIDLGFPSLVPLGTTALTATTGALSPLGPPIHDAETMTILQPVVSSLGVHGLLRHSYAANFVALVTDEFADSLGVYGQRDANDDLEVWLSRGPTPNRPLISFQFLAAQPTASTAEVNVEVGSTLLLW